MIARARRWWPAALTVAAAVAGSCTEINTSADHVAALEFDSLAYPAVVTGDSLRDSLGRVAALHALALNGRGDVVAAPNIQYIALDSGVTIDAAGHLIAQRRDGTVRLLANAGNLQSPPRALIVARRPDTIVVSGTGRDTISYVLGGSPAVNVSNALTVKLATRDTGGGVTATQGWLVSYQALFHGTAIAATDTTVATLVGDAGGPSGVDTTDATGTAARKIRLRPIGLTQSLTDSVVVLATVRYRGAAVRGSPIRFVVVFRPKP